MILRDPALGEYLESSWFWESEFIYGLVYNAIQDQPSFHKPDLLRGIRGNLGSKMGLIRKRAKISFCELEFKNQ